MENLNAEQLVDLLDHCSKSKSCDGCMMLYNPRFLEARSYDPGLVCGKVLIRWAAEHIKSQEQEIKRLEKRCALRDQDNKATQDLLYKAETEIDKLHASCTELEQNLHSCKAHTVMKMHSMLCEGRVSNDNVVIVANHIAKELIGEGK